MTAGLERYMPTPLFRLRVTKKRLDIEIFELKTRLNKYERLVNTGVTPSTDDLQKRVIHLRQRVRMLEDHEQQVSRELQALMTYGPAFYHLGKGLQKFQQTADRLLNTLQVELKRLLLGKTRLRMESKGQELISLQEVLAECIADKSTSPAEISQLINQYEQTIREMEHLALHLHQVKGFQPFIPKH